MTINPILDGMREDDIRHDPWGTNINWLFAVCDGLTLYGYSVPGDLDYRPSPYYRAAVANWRETGRFCIDYGYAGRIVAGLLIDGDIAAVEYAARVMNKFDSVCRMNGRNY